MSDSPEALVQSVIGSVESLDSSNLSSVIDKAKTQGNLLDVGDYLSQQRPDLADEIEHAVDDALAQFD